MPRKEISYLPGGTYHTSHHSLDYARIRVSGIVLHQTVRFPHSVENLPREWGMQNLSHSTLLQRYRVQNALKDDDPQVDVPGNVGEEFRDQVAGRTDGEGNRQPL